MSENLPPWEASDNLSVDAHQAIVNKVNEQSQLLPREGLETYRSPVGQSSYDPTPIIIRDRRIGRIIGSDLTYRPVLVGCQYWVQCLFIKPLQPSPIASLTRSGSTGTLVNVAHGYLVGDVFEIQGATQELWNLRFTVLVVVDADTVTFTVNSGAASTATTTGVITATFIPPADLATENSDYPETGVSNDNTAGSVVLATNLDELALDTHLLAEDSTVKVEVFAMYDHSNPQRPRWFFSRAVPTSPPFAPDCCGDCNGCGKCMTVDDIAVLPAGIFPSHVLISSNQAATIFAAQAKISAAGTDAQGNVYMNLTVPPDLLRTGQPDISWKLCRIPEADLKNIGPVDHGGADAPIYHATYSCTIPLGTYGAGAVYTLTKDVAATIPFTDERLKLVIFVHFWTYYDTTDLVWYTYVTGGFAQAFWSDTFDWNFIYDPTFNSTEVVQSNSLGVKIAAWGFAAVGVSILGTRGGFLIAPASGVVSTPAKYSAASIGLTDVASYSGHIYGGVSTGSVYSCLRV